MGNSELDEKKAVQLKKKDLDDLIKLNDDLLERHKQLVQRNRDLKEKAAFLEHSLTPIVVRRPKSPGNRLRRYIGTVTSFSYRNLFRRRWRTTLTVLSLVAAVTGFICTVNISQSIGFTMTSAEAERALFAGGDVGYPYFCDILVAPEHPWWYDLPMGDAFRGPSSLVSGDMLTKIRAIPGVDWAQPYVGDVRIQFDEASRGNGMSRKEWIVRHESGTIDSFSSDILIAGVDPEIEPRRLGKRCIFLQGRPIQGTGYEVMVGYSFAKSHNLSVGDTLIIPAEKHVCTHDSPGKLRESEFRGLWHSFWAWSEDQWQEHFSFSIEKEVQMKIVGIYWTTTPYDDFAITTYTGLQEMLGFGNRVTAIFVKLKPEVDVGKTLNALWSAEDVNIYIPLLRKRYTTGADQVGSAFSGVAPTKFVSMANLQNIAISEVAAGIFIASVVYTSVHERRWEIGLLKSLGFKSTFVLCTLMMEALILGLFAGIVGFIVSSLLSVLSIGILLPTGQFIPLLSSVLPRMELKMTLDWGILAIGLSTATSLASSFIPAYFAATLPPIEAMREG